MQKLIFSTLLLLLLQQTVHAQDALRKTHFNVTNSIALNGYDAVSYFNQKKPVESMNVHRSKISPFVYTENG
jgi:hypothetical protein